MDFQELKDIIRQDGGKVIIVENDKAQFVVMSFEEYKRKSGQSKPSPSFAPPVQKQEREREDLSASQAGLTIDDLPLS